MTCLLVSCSALLLLSAREPYVVAGADVSEQTVAALTPVLDDTNFSFVHARRQMGTRLQRSGSAPEVYRDPPLGLGTSLVRYSAVVGELKAWLLFPRHGGLRTSAGYPTVVYLHDGWAVSAEELEHADAFAEAGLLVVVPAWRGENGNPGQYELLFGELDDLTAAVHFTLTLPDADRTRVALFGHGLGGMLSALGALIPGLPVHETGSSAGLANESVFKHLDPPFEDSEIERRWRLMGPHLEHLQSPHRACIGLEDEPLLAAANRLNVHAQQVDAPLTLITEAGGRSSSRKGCEKRYVKRLVQLFAPRLTSSRE